MYLHQVPLSADDIKGIPDWLNGILTFVMFLFNGHDID